MELIPRFAAVHELASHYNVLLPSRSVPATELHRSVRCGPGAVFRSSRGIRPFQADRRFELIPASIVAIQILPALFTFKDCDRRLVLHPINSDGRYIDNEM
jgi:hypothetical protein